MININNEIKRIKSLINNNWIKTVRPGSTGVGATFEYLMNIKENKSTDSDLKRIELKTKRVNSKVSTCLFSCAPEGPGENIIKRISALYGYRDEEYHDKKRLTAFIYNSYKSKGKTNYQFRLNVNYDSRTLNLIVYDKNGVIIDDKIYWTFATLRQCLYRKCTRIAVIEAESRFLYGVEHFKYKSLKIYELISFNKFLKLIEENIICVAINTTIYKSGPRIGELHDHGASFRLYFRDFEKLFNKIY
ncbi:MAG: hypothetical protein J1F35_06805 [Erysipelotrichales bacterium]|nr:hypothetical protein [Erysipelotrichales bacterium]